MKKIIGIICLAILCSFSFGVKEVAQGQGYDLSTSGSNAYFNGIIANDDGSYLFKKGRHAYQYPVLGADEANSYAINPEQCFYKIEGNKAYLTCLVYVGNGGIVFDGVGKVHAYKYTFETYKEGSRRVINLVRVEDYLTGKESNTYNIYTRNACFLEKLFWQAAKYSHLAKILN